MNDLPLLGALLQNTWTLYKKHWQSIAVVGAILGLAVGLLASVVAANTAYQVQTGMGFDPQTIQNLQERVNNGDQQAQQELKDIAKSFNPAQLATAIAIGLRTMAIMWLITLLAYSVYQAFLVVLAVSGMDEEARKRGPGYILPMIGLNLWLFVRTFIWIPGIGFIIAIILGPRFVASHAILVSEKKGIMASASESYRRTQSLWGKIFGNVFVAGLVAGIATWLVGGIVRIFLPAGIDDIATAVVQTLSAAFTLLFMTLLGLAIAKRTPPAVMAAVSTSPSSM